MRILIAGSRVWEDFPLLESVLRAAHRDADHGAILVHGAAVGVDIEAVHIWQWLGNPTEAHPYERYGSPRARNQHMVDLGADICLAFATSWASGTGMCARMARKAGIPVIDWGVSTAIEDR
jgi:hypothetical protein